MQHQKTKVPKKLPKRCSHVASNRYLKYERYRRFVGKPRGPGRAGNKSGRNAG